MKPHVLVVDDSLTIRMDLRGALVAAGFDVTLCETKRAAEAMLDQYTFAAAVLDVMLPDGNGVDILRRIRASSDHAALPVVMLSSEADVGARVRGLMMGANEYVGKPYNIAYFIRRLRSLCRRDRNTTPPPGSIAGCRRILAVDDSPTFLTHLGRMLRDDGHDVVFARSGLEALEMLAAQTIDCVIVDLIMPDIDGLETIRRIRQTPGRESTPTLMLTASENPEDQRNAAAAGADEFVVKDVALASVSAKIRALLRRKHRDASTVDPPNSSARITVLSERSADASASTSSPPAIRMSSPMVLAIDNKSAFCPLFLQVAMIMGLEADHACNSLARTLGRMNIDAHAMNHADLSRALPTLRDMLAMFFSAEEVALRADALAALVAQSRGAAA